SSERTCLDLADVVAEALGIAKYYKGMKSRAITVTVSPDLPPIIGVRGQLVSVFLNLILNAIDATSKGGQIEIGACVEAGALRTWARDDGPGTAAEHRDRLFQPYFTTKRHGTGLGLFVCRQFVAEHGGEIACDLPIGLGTRFTVRL